MNAPPSPDPETVYEVSESGRQQLKGGSTMLFADALRFLLLANGKLSYEQIAAILSDVPEAILGRTVFDLQHKGFIQPVQPAAPAEAADLGSLDFSSPASPDPAADGGRPEEEIALRTKEAQDYLAVLKEQGYAVRIARQARSTVTPSSGGAYSVLIVEDEPPLAGTVRKFLLLEGFAPRVAASREELAAELKKPPLPDLILLDAMLAGASGFDILERLRGHPVLKSIPVIMVTAMSARKDVMRALAAEANGYITKPFKLDVLLKGIKAVLGVR